MTIGVSNCPFIANKVDTALTKASTKTVRIPQIVHEKLAQQWSLGISIIDVFEVA